MRTDLVLSPALFIAIAACSNNGSSGPAVGSGDSGTPGSSSGGSGGSSGGSSSGSSGGASAIGGGSSSGSTGSSGSSSSGSGGGSSSSGAIGGDGSDGGVDGGMAGGSDGGSACSSLPLCDGFESDTPGTAPSASLWTVIMGCNPNMQDTAADGGLLVGVDNTQSHTGKNSLRVVGGDSCGYYVVNASAFSKLGGGPLYARFFARFSGAPTQNHNGFLSMTTSGAGDAGGDHIRLGFQDNVVAWNAQNSDSTLPDMDPQGTTLSSMTNPNSWDCIEFSVDYKTGDIQFWLNGTTVQGLSFASSQAATQGVNDQWARGGPKVPFAITSFGVGWLGLNNQYTVWFDDIALAGSRVGCQ